MYCSFGGTVGTGKRGDQHAGNTADIDHQPLVATQRREQRAGNADDGKYIGFKLLVHTLDAAIEQRPHRAVTGVIDQHVQPAACVLQLPGQMRQCLRVVHVQLYGVEPCRRQSRHILRFAGAGPHVMPGRLEGIGQGAANTAGTTADQNTHGNILNWKNCLAGVRRETRGFAGDNRRAAAALAGSPASWPRLAVRRGRGSAGRCRGYRPG